MVDALFSQKITLVLNDLVDRGQARFLLIHLKYLQMLLDFKSGFVLSICCLTFSWLEKLLTALDSVDSQHGSAPARAGIDWVGQAVAAQEPGEEFNQSFDS